MKANEFLKNHGLRVEDVDSDKVLGFFSSEMKKGLEGKASSLAMIPTYSEAGHKIPEGGKRHSPGCRWNQFPHLPCDFQ